jgi:arginine-tRNA-protein transferase
MNKGLGASFFSQMDSEKPNQIYLIGSEESQGHCGYCKKESSSKSTFYIHAFSLAPKEYQNLIDRYMSGFNVRGWRRSGTTIYKADITKSCCCQYTIRLDTREFTPSKSMKKVVRKFGNSIAEADIEPCDAFITWEDSDLFVKSIGTAELGKLRVVLEPSSFAQDSFELWRLYQSQIHNDTPDKCISLLAYKTVSKKSYKSFLVESPLTQIESTGFSFGSFHQKYYLNGMLIAVAVIDILPSCISSVYFFYHPDHASKSLGVYSALREIAFTKCLTRLSPSYVYI